MVTKSVSSCQSMEFVSAKTALSNIHLSANYHPRTLQTSQQPILLQHQQWQCPVTLTNPMMVGWQTLQQTGAHATTSLCKKNWVGLMPKTSVFHLGARWHPFTQQTQTTSLLPTWSIMKPGLVTTLFMLAIGSGRMGQMLASTDGPQEVRNLSNFSSRG